MKFNDEVVVALCRYIAEQDPTRLSPDKVAHTGPTDYSDVLQDEINELKREADELNGANTQLHLACQGQAAEIRNLNQEVSNLRERHALRLHLVEDLEAELKSFKEANRYDRDRAIYRDGYLDALQDLDRTCVEMLKENQTDLGADLIREVRHETFRKAGEHGVEVPPMMRPDQVVSPPPAAPGFVNPE